MSDDTTADGTPDMTPDTTPDTTPTEVLDATPVAAPEADAPEASRRSTRTILEIVGGVAAAILIVAAAGAGFAAGLVVGDERDGHRGYEQAGGMRDDGMRGDGMRGDDMGPGWGDDGRGHHGADGLPMPGSAPEEAPPGQQS